MALQQGTERPKLVPIPYEERVHLLSLFNDPVFVKAWRNAQLSRPALFTASKDEAYFPQACAHRLHQLQGWEMFQVALLRQTDDPKPAQPKLTENFPDAGTLEADIKRNLPSSITKP